MIKPLKYYFANGSLVIFNKYTIENGVIKNKKTGKVVSTQKLGKYNNCSVQGDNGKRHNIVVCRAIASSIHGPPPTLTHTADHIDRNPDNDTDDNIRWCCRHGQRKNQTRSETLKTAFMIVKDDIEKTNNEWVEHLKNEKNPHGRNYTAIMIRHYAQKKQYGFSYKEYPNLSGEVWLKITDTKSKKGYWEISNMNRIKYITKYAENVLSGERLLLKNGYPTIAINGTNWPCHILAFMSFFPEEYANKKSCEIILHEDDEKHDFRPHKLRLGTRSDNMNDAHNNGCYDNTQKARQKCASYINGVLEKEHESQSNAVKYLVSVGYDKARCGAISLALNEKLSTVYGRNWKLVY